jgi:uncharacterized membrane protein YjdF
LGPAFCIIIFILKLYLICAFLRFQICLFVCMCLYTAYPCIEKYECKYASMCVLLLGFKFSTPALHSASNNYDRDSRYFIKLYTYSPL